MGTFGKTRRDFMKSLGACAVSTLLGGMTSQARNDRKRYNVLLICVDDLRPQLGCFGHTKMISPNIDRLAGEGRLFTRHYVQMAVCGPSRCSMLTSRRLGVWDCWKELRKRKTEPEEPEPAEEEAPPETPAPEEPEKDEKQQERNNYQTPNSRDPTRD